MAEIGQNQGRVLTRYAEGGAIGANLIVVAGTANNQVKLPGAAEAGAIIGITRTAAAAAGDALEVVVDGIVDLICDGTGTAITPGLFLAAKGTNGYGMAWTLANTKYPIAKALDSSAAAGDKIAVLITHFAPPAT